MLSFNLFLLTMSLMRSRPYSSISSIGDFIAFSIASSISTSLPMPSGKNPIPKSCCTPLKNSARSLLSLIICTFSIFFDILEGSRLSTEILEELMILRMPPRIYSINSNICSPLTYGAGSSPPLSSSVKYAKLKFSCVPIKYR